MSNGQACIIHKKPIVKCSKFAAFGIVSFVLLSHCLLLAKALVTGDTDEIAQIIRSGQFRSLARY